MSFSIIGASGELERYPDLFGDVSDEQVREAMTIEQDIIQAKNIVYLGFYAIAEMLDRFEREKLYKARGFERFKDWLESPEIEISYRVAQDLIRIQREVIPMLETESGLTHEEIRDKLLKAGVSKVRALLPFVSKQEDHENFNTLLDEAPLLTWRDLRKKMDQVRGNEEDIEDGYPAIFTTIVRKETDDHIRVSIQGSDGNTIQELGELFIRKDWYDRWINRIPTNRGN